MLVLSSLRRTGAAGRGEGVHSSGTAYKAEALKGQQAKATAGTQEPSSLGPP